MNSIENTQKVREQDAKKVFRKLGTCSRTFFYLLNREFGYNNEVSERAADPLAGGILEEGYQCGMLWGASLAVGAEAHRTCAHLSQAIAVSVEATRNLMESFEKQEQTVQCREITRCDFHNRFSFAKYMLSGRFLHCFDLAQKWAPDAVKEAKKALKQRPHDFEFCMSCASEVVRKMGASEEEMVMVSGFAGGLGLSGGGCGALAAVLWMNALDWCREHDKGSANKDPNNKEILHSFLLLTRGKMRCEEISRTSFSSMKEHTDYLKKGGCLALIDGLSEL